jgi:hypothetical protein
MKKDVQEALAASFPSMAPFLPSLSAKALAAMMADMEANKAALEAAKSAPKSAAKSAGPSPVEACLISLVKRLSNKRVTLADFLAAATDQEKVDAAVKAAKEECVSFLKSNGGKDSSNAGQKAARAAFLAAKDEASLKAAMEATYSFTHDTGKKKGQADTLTPWEADLPDHWKVPSTKD